MSNAATERGLLVKLDEGFFARLDHETAIRRAASRPSWAAARVRLHRTDVVRSLLREALDARALARGEVVPESAEADVTKGDRGATAFVGGQGAGAEPGSVPVKEADTEAVTAPIPVEAIIGIVPTPLGVSGPVVSSADPVVTEPLYFVRVDAESSATSLPQNFGTEKTFGASVGLGVEGDPAAASPDPEPEPVKVGHVGGEGALGPNVRMVGVRRT